MRNSLQTWAWLAVLSSLLCPIRTWAADAALVEVASTDGKVAVSVGGRPIATYVYQHDKILRPFFSDVKTPEGIPLTRNFPPVAGQDATDHDLMHPGLWLAFGSLGGADFWRNQGRVIHESFVEEPKGAAGKGSFAVANRYMDKDKPIAREVCTLTFLVRPAGILLIYDSRLTFVADTKFGPQEEMGWGLRVASPLAVAKGGQISDSKDRRNEPQVWGKQAAWCDYSGKVQDRLVGIALMPDPGGSLKNCWFHARDYGLLVANPVGAPGFEGADTKGVAWPANKECHLRCGFLLHSSAEGAPPKLAAAYEDYLEQIKPAQK